MTYCTLLEKAKGILQSCKLNTSKWIEDVTVNGEVVASMCVMVGVQVQSLVIDT
jgi:hypothetical protein